MALIKEYFQPLTAKVDYQNVEWEKLNVQSQYLIIFTGRSGSTLLNKLLANTDLCGNPRELFSHDFIRAFFSGRILFSHDFIQEFLKESELCEFGEYFNYVASKFSSNGLFGFEIDARRYFQLADLIDFDSVFDAKKPIPVIWLTRQDIVSQAFSFAQAQKTGVWHVLNDGNTVGNEFRNNELVVDDVTIWRELIAILLYEQKIEQEFQRAQLVPLRITYEELITSNTLVIAKVLHYIGASHDDVAHRVLKLNEETQPTLQMKYLNKDIILGEFYSRYKSLVNEVIEKRKSIEIDYIKSNLIGYGLNIN